VSTSTKIARGPASRAASKHNRYGYLFFTPFFLVMAAAIAAPLLYAVYLSFFQDRLVGGTVFVGFDNYTRAFKDTLFQVGLLRVALFFAVQVPIMLGLAIVAALAIDSGRLRLPSLFRVGIFVPYAVPAVVAALMWGYLYGPQFGLVRQIGDFLGVQFPNLLSSNWMLASIANINTWEFVGYNMLILYAALRAIPEDLYEAASMDGAGEFRKAWSIKLPALRPALFLTLIFSIIGSFQLFNEPNILAAPNMYAFNLAFNGQQFNYSAAIAVVLGGVTAILAYAVQLRTARRERLG
jgi:multiple sugar transport system permease protein